MRDMTNKTPQTNETDQDSSEHITDLEREVLAQQIAVPSQRISYSELFRYADNKDLLVIIISFLCAVISGAIITAPALLTALLVGSIQESWAKDSTAISASSELVRFTIYFVYLFLGELVTCYIATIGFIRTGIVLSSRIREQYLAALLRQNVAFFDRVGAGEIATHMTADVNLIRDGISEKVSVVVQCGSAIVTAFVIGLIRDWKLTLVLACGPVCIALILAVGGMLITKSRQRWLAETAEAGTVVEEVFSSIKTVVGLNAQSELASRYDGFLEKAGRWATQARTISGALLGAIFAVIYMAIGLGFWMGSRFLVKGTTSYVDILAIILATVTGIACLGSIVPPLQSFSIAVAAGSRLYGTIDRKPQNEPAHRSTTRPDVITGHLELKNVRHIYASRQEVVVLDGLTISIEPGKTTAIVGPSGSGKSTIIDLLERFYDPIAGEILLDGQNLSEIDPQWLRQHMSLVQQNPTLFDTTIFENVRYGLVGTPYENSSEQEARNFVHEACRTANAHEFISKLPSGYDTPVGEAGVMLSGGQRQRIAIARALVRKPSILLLDEATSALDSTSETAVQAAIERASRGRTTVVVAHRLSTIKTADKIIVLSGGRLIEQGTHSDLLELNGMYTKLAHTQTVHVNSESESDIDTAAHILGPANHPIIQGEKASLHVPGTFHSPTTDIETLRTLDHPGSEYSIWTLVTFMMKMHKGSVLQILHGFLWSLQAGAGAPIQAVFLAKCLVALARPPSRYQLLRSEINLWAGMHVVLAFVQLLAYTAQATTLGGCTEKLIRDVSGETFRALLDKDMAFFDIAEHGVGALTSFISTEPSSIAGVGCYAVGTYITALTTLVGAISASIAVGWKLGLVGSATIPILLVCGLLRYCVMAQLDAHLRKDYQETASLASEAVSSIRTVMSLDREPGIMRTFHQKLSKQNSTSIRASLRSSALFSFSQSATMLCTALGLWYGGTLVISGEYGLFQFILSHAAINICGEAAGQIFSSSPDLAKAKNSATRLKALLDQRTPAHIGCEATRPLLEGHIEFRNVHFAYPTRPGQRIFNGFDLTVHKGKYVALVGSSGCGKSTIVAMLEHFYRPIAGSITVDGISISSLDVTAYRDQVALVNQEPTLFQGAIRENLTLGLGRECSQHELEKACKDVYLLEFIRSLP